MFATTICVLGLSTASCRCADEAIEVTHDEFGPRAALKKYEWFKNAAAALDAKLADIKVLEDKQKRFESMYEGVPRSKWARDDREEWSTAADALAGVKLSYNSLAADYNAQMAKFNWSFAEAGKLPPGATTPLPRSYKPYVEN